MLFSAFFWKPWIFVFSKWAQAGWNYTHSYKPEFSTEHTGSYKSGLNILTISIPKRSPCHPAPRAVALLKSWVLSMAWPALQSSLKRKTGAGELNRGINTHHFSSSECSTLSNPAAPDGLIYCTKWIVFGYTLYSQMFLWFSPSLSLSFLCPVTSAFPLSDSDQFTDSAELSGWFVVAAVVLRDSGGSDKRAKQSPADGTHSGCRSTSTLKQRLTNSPLHGLMFLFPIWKKKNLSFKQLCRIYPGD